MLPITSSIYSTNKVTKINTLNSYNVIFTGKVCIKLDKIDSTNNYAWKLLQKKPLPIEGTLIQAHTQNAGKGQRDSAWESAAGENITISLIFYPKTLVVKKQFYLNQAIALGVLRFVNDVLDVPCTIKWPNDIYCGNRKLGGILIENSVSGDVFNSSIVGIGINVHQTEFPAYLPNPTSITNLTQKQYQLPDLITKLCHYLEVEYLRLKADKLSEIKEDYLQSLYRYNAYHPYHTKDGRLYAKIVDVTDIGRLVLELQGQTTGFAFFKKNKRKDFDIKEVVFL